MEKKEMTNESDCLEDLGISTAAAYYLNSQSLALSVQNQVSLQQKLGIEGFAAATRGVYALLQKRKRLRHAIKRNLNCSSGGLKEEHNRE